MPSINRTQTVKSKNKDSLSSLLSDFSIDDDTLYQFSDDELDTMISELQTSSSARSPEEIDKMNSTKFESAVKSMQFCSISSDKAVLSVDDVKESDKITEGIDNQMIKLAMKSSVVFAFVHGNVTTKKAWIRITHVDKGKSNYVSFPLLNAVGSRSVLVHVYRDEISKFLEKGKKNTLALILEKSNITVKKEKIKYLFPKGHLLASDKTIIDAIRTDLNHIFEEMAKPIEKRKFELKWFTV
jgi:hypothetical protein